VPDSAGTVERVALELGNALRELQRVLAPDHTLETLAQFGVAFPPQLLADPGFETARSVTVKATEDLDGAIADLRAAIAAENTGAIVIHGIRVLEAANRTRTAFADLQAQLLSVGPTMPGVTAAQIAELTTNFPEKLFNFLVTEQLDTVPAVGATLTMLGLVDRTYHPAPPGSPSATSYETSTLRFDRLGPLLTGPEKHFSDLYDWGLGSFDGSKLLPAVAQLVARMGLPSRYEPPAGGQPARAEAFALALTAAPAAGSQSPGLDVEILLPVGGAIERQLALPHPAWSAHLEVTAASLPGVGGTIRPPLDVTLRPPTGEIRGDVELTIEGRPASPFVLVGAAGGSRLEVGGLDVGAGFDIAFDVTAREAAIAPRIAGSVSGGKLVIDTSQGDGFISTLLSGLKLEAGFGAGVTWSSDTGVRFDGSSTIEIALPVHVELGPLKIPTLYLILGFKDGGFPLELSADMSAELGPLTASTSRIGALASLSFPAGGGNLGPAHLTFAFKPPNGVGLAVNAGVVKGGGFLYIDVERGEYAGALELDFSGIVSLKAIGLITTRMPDGSSGFSLLIVITAEFGSGIQLGFGFTLLAVGGVVGLNRTMALGPLMEGVRSNAISSVMFPRDVVANAPRIISDLRTFFPPHEGTFLIGPMAKLGWGTPPLVSLSLGVIIEIPGNVAILGVLRVALPADQLAVIVIQVNFVGAIEFDRKRVYFFAGLFDSRILFITLEGEMAVLAAFGDDANFVLSVGGFHPAFKPPPLPVPSPRRIAIDILNQPLGRLRAEGYLAVTTNTFQFGARVEARLGFSDFGIEGHLGLDALVQFSPLHFIVTISASLSLKAFGVGLFSIRLRLQLEGPTPWRAQGTGSISLLFWDIEVDFDITWGEERPTELPPIAVTPLLGTEFDKETSWSALLPQGSNLLVSLRRLDPAEKELVLHPVGVLRVTQRAVPLDLTITRVGNQRPTDANRFSLTVESDGLAKRGDVNERFAPAQFQDFDDATKLSKPAFQEMPGGIDLSASGAQLTSGAMVKRVIRYELITIDSAHRRHQRFQLLFPLLFVHLLAGNAVAKSELSKAAEVKLKPFSDGVAVKGESFAVASQTTNQPIASFASEAMANEQLQSQLAANPNLAGALHVIPSFEAAAV
jgi:hypothetical protein